MIESRSPDSIRKLLATVAIFSLLVIVVSFAVICFRAQVSVTRHFANDSCRHRRTDVGLNVMESNCTGKRNIGLGDVPIHFNSLGFRDKDRSAMPEPGVFRVILIGGSTDVGLGIENDEDTLGWLVEDELRQKGFRYVEFMNLSTEGYQVAKHSLRFNSYLRDSNPGLVLIDGFADYKIFEDYAVWSAMRVEDDGKPAKVLSLRDTVLGPVVEKLGPESRLSFWLNSTFEGFRLLRVRLRLSLMGNDAKERTLYLMRHQIRLLKRMSRSCERHNCRVAALYDAAVDESDRSAHIFDESQAMTGVGRWVFGARLDPIKKRALVNVALQNVVELSGRLPLSSQPEYFLGQTRYYSVEGMKKYAAAIADALIPLLPEGQK